MAHKLRERARKFLGAQILYDDLVTFAESEAALARKQEREECVKAMCIYCRRGILLEGSCHRNSNGDFLDVCRALAIHAGNGEDKG